GFNQAQIDKLSGQIGRRWDGNLWSLSPEEMKALRSNVDMWTQIQNTGKGGYGGRLTEKLDDYIDQAGKLEELTDQLYEGLTGISFDGMYSSFIDNLMNMKYGAKDAAEDISEYFMKAMLSNKIGELYSEK
ncbi:viral A-type inclusion protein, partial [Parabacteroides distasonis]|nr:viral A-type inclusion protein [Parabacteroides distasonis]